jgi:acyl-CoA thioester hydrolase
MDDLPITHRGAVMPWECDYMGHMNVTFYTAKFDQATWPFFASIGFTVRHMREQGVGVGAVRYDIRYRHEMLSGDTLTVRTRLLEVRDKVIHYLHEMYADQAGVLAATAEVTAVHIDTAKRKSCPFAPEILEKARALLARDEKLPPAA